MDYKITAKWKEVLIYAEGENEFVFSCGWGVHPGVIHVPSASCWEEATPEWMHGRRDEVIDRLQDWAKDHDVLEETDRGYTADLAKRQWVSIVGVRGDWYFAILMNPDETAPPDTRPGSPEWEEFTRDRRDRIGEGTTWDDAEADLKRKLEAQGIRGVRWAGGIIR